MENCGTSCHEDLIFDRTANNMGIGSDKAVVADFEPMASAATKDSILHDNAFSSDLNGATFSNDLCTEENSTITTNYNISTYCCVWCDVCCRVYLRRLALVFDEHVQT
jgi:hypothetical protein